LYNKRSKCGSGTASLSVSRTTAAALSRVHGQTSTTVETGTSALHPPSSMATKAAADTTTAEGILMLWLFLFAPPYPTREDTAAPGVGTCGR